MDGKTHKTIGICSGIIASEVMISSNISMENIILGGMLITGSILGSILLDIDKKGTLISKKVPFLSKIVRIATTHRGITHWFPLWILIGFLLMHWLNVMTEQTTLIVTLIYSLYATCYFVNVVMKKYKKNKKNKYLKYAISVVIGTLATYFIYTRGDTFMNTLLFCVFIGLLIGVATHLFLDALTPMGIPLIGKKRIHLAYLNSQIVAPIICISGWILVFFFTGYWYIIR